MAYILERDGSTGFDWCSKRNKKRKGGNQTAGRQKSWNCQATTLEKFMAKRNRSFKHPSYSTWSKTHTGGKTPGKA